eukprot:Skav200062  [mRNA]  locus=scaffold838:60928:65286:+ [translate_table: standard]
MLISITFDLQDDENIKKFNEAVGATIPEKPATPAVPQPGSTRATGGAAAPATQEIDPALRAVLTQFLTQGGGTGMARAPLPMTSVLTTEVLQSLLTDEAACSTLAQRRRRLAGPGSVAPRNLLGAPRPAEVINGASGDALELLCRAMESKFKDAVRGCDGGEEMG